jgi:hypothetical protein
VSGRRDTSKSDRSGSRSGLPALATVALVFLVALGSSRSADRVGGPGRVLHGRSIVGDVAIVGLALLVAVLGGLVYAVLGGGKRRRRPDDEPEITPERLPMAWWEKPLSLIVALALIGGLVAILIALVRHVSAGGGGARAVSPTTSPGAPPGGSRHGGESAGAHAGASVVHWWLFAGLVLLLLAAGVVMLLRRRRLRHTEAKGGALERSELRETIAISLEELEHERDPRRAVIGAYVGMERDLARQGLARLPFETPLEYLARALALIQASRSAGERLTVLFERARFSVHAVDPQMKRDAIAALGAVRDELERDSG